MTIIDRLTKVFGLASRDNTLHTSSRWIPARQAGVIVNHDSALTLSAVFAAIRLISEDIAKLPWQTFYRKDDGSRERVSNSKIEHLLDTSPNPEMTAFSFRETLVAWAMSWGNGYAEIERDVMGRAIALWPISPDRVSCKRDEVSRLYYEVSNPSGPASIVLPQNMYHLHGLGFDGLTGYSVISYAARSIGSGIAADQFGASFFGNNATLGGYLQHPNKLGDTAYDRLKAWIDKRKGPTEAYKPAVLEEGMTWVAAGIPPKDSQFLESRKFTVTDVARWFRVPPHKLADLERATFSNIEEQNIDYVNDTLISWITRLEQEAKAKLISPRAKVNYTKLNVNALLRGSAGARANFYREMVNLGVFSVNEVRAREDENPIGPDGDKRVMQMNMTTLEKIGEDQPAPEPAPAIAPPEGEGEEDQEQEVSNLYYKIVAKTFVGIYTREDRRFHASGGVVPESDFVDWLNGYFAQDGDHLVWVADVLTESLSAVASEFKAEDLVGVVVDRYIQSHTHNSRSRALAYYRNETTLKNKVAASTEATAIVNDLVEDCMIQRLEDKS